jgi:DNA polymerase-3 subunit delta'
MKPWLANDKAHFLEQLKQRALPHAIILSGVKGAGKIELAQWLSNVLLCEKITTDYLASINNFNNNGNFQNIPCQNCKSCNLHHQQTHPDLVSIELTSASIGVDQIRKVSRFFEKTAQLASNQVVVIEDAESKTESAANALLKNLEEPTDNSYIILLVNDEQRLLPTIISRCRHVQLKPPIGSDLLNYLNKSDTGGKDPFANLTHLSELCDENINQQYITVMNCFIHFLVKQNQRMTLLGLILENEDGIKWLERIIINLIRKQHQWHSQIEIDGFSNEMLLQFINNNKENIWQVYLLIKRYNKQSLTIAQLNKEYSLEKMLVEILAIMTVTEE